MPTHTHALSFSATEVRKAFVNGAEEADREWQSLRLLAEHAPGIAPRPLRREVDAGRQVVVMERIPGESLGSGPLTVAQTISLGQTIRRLHGIPVEHIRVAGIGERRLGPSALPQALEGWLSETPDLTRCQDPARVSAGISAAREWLARVEVLPVPRLEAFGIADLNPANIVWDGRLCRLVDFEDAGLTDPAYDLADHVEHIAVRLPGVFDARSLSAAVGLSAEDEERMQSFRPLWAAFWLVMLLPGNGGFLRNPAGTTESQADHLLALIS